MHGPTTPISMTFGCNVQSRSSYESNMVRHWVMAAHLDVDRIRISDILDDKRFKSFGRPWSVSPAVSLAKILDQTSTSTVTRQR